MSGINQLCRDKRMMQYADSVIKRLNAKESSQPDQVPEKEYECEHSVIKKAVVNLSVHLLLSW